MDAHTIRVLSVCSGSGMFDAGLGFAIPGARTVCYVEREAAAIENLERGIEAHALDDAPIWSDLATFDGAAWRGQVDCVIGGYPCQDFSCAGKRAGLDGDKGRVWGHAARVVGEVEPALVFFENVPGHLTLGFDTVYSDLERMGYRIAAGLFSAEEVGASHKRERLFILGVAGGMLRQPPERTGQPDGGDSTVANPENPNKREYVERARQEGRTATQGTGGELADTELESNGPQYEHAARKRKKGPEVDRPVSRKPGPQLAYSAIERGRGVPLFAPGPNDLDAWSEILKLDPALEPAICRTPDGLAPGMDSDRLRITGNGVVPLVAAYAFLSLWAALEASA